MLAETRINLSFWQMPKHDFSASYYCSDPLNTLLKGPAPIKLIALDKIKSIAGLMMPCTFFLSSTWKSFDWIFSNAYLSSWVVEILLPSHRLVQPSLWCSLPLCPVHQLNQSYHLGNLS